jgi:hypothetical protein
MRGKRMVQGDMVLVEWEDAHHTRHRWDVEECSVRTVGFLVEKSRRRIRIAQSEFCTIDDEGHSSLQANDITTVPRGMVRKVTKLRNRKRYV